MDSLFLSLVSHFGHWQPLPAMIANALYKVCSVLSSLFFFSVCFFSNGTEVSIYTLVWNGIDGFIAACVLVVSVAGAFACAHVCVCVGGGGGGGLHIPFFTLSLLSGCDAKSRGKTLNLAPLLIWSSKQNLATAHKEFSTAIGVVGCSYGAQLLSDRRGLSFSCSPGEVAKFYGKNARMDIWSCLIDRFRRSAFARICPAPAQSDDAW